MSKSRITVLFVLMVLLLLVLVTGRLFVLRATPKFTPPPLPSPNGYDGLKQAVEMLHHRNGFYQEMQDEELEEVVEHNAPALEIARASLELDCGVPMDWTWDPVANGPNPALLDQPQGMRDLARAFSAEVIFKLSRGQPSEAADAGLDAYRLGTKCSEGGLMVSHLVGNAIRTVSIHHLALVVAQAPGQRDNVLQGLIPMLESNESADEVIQREIDYIKAASRGFLGWITNSQAIGPIMQPAIQAAQEAEQRELATGRLFVLHLSIQLYHEQRGSWPESLEELSPDLLPEIPLDPFSDASFIYRIVDDSYVLYGVGRNKKDDGGFGDEMGLSSDLVYDIDLEAIEQRENR